MRLYDESVRSEMQQKIIDYMQRQPEVIAVIAVGSGSYGFRDRYSDLDFSIVLEQDVDTNKFMEKVGNFIREQSEIQEEICNQKRNLQIILLNNFLEIDLGYVNFSSVTAKREHWKVVYDKSKSIEQKMKESWENNKYFGKTENVNVEMLYQKYARTLFTYVFHAVVAMKRKMLWRAAGEINIIRDIAIELLGYHYELETKRYRYVDKFPKEILDKLDSTVVGMEESAMLQSLMTLIEIIYDEFDSHYKGDYPYSMKREDIMEYVKNVLEDDKSQKYM